MTLDNVLLSSALHSSKFIFIPVLIAITAEHLMVIMRRCPRLLMHTSKRKESIKMFKKVFKY